MTTGRDESESPDEPGGRDPFPISSGGIDQGPPAPGDDDRAEHAANPESPGPQAGPDRTARPVAGDPHVSVVDGRDPLSSAAGPPLDQEPGPTPWQAGSIAPGQLLFGCYRVEEKLGDGGMGEVWRVHHVELDCPRALKVILPRFAIHESIRVRFGREARVMARVGHPHIVVVHNASLSGDAAFIEMEYIRGQGLNTRLTPGVPMPPDWVGRLLDQLCDALQAAHEHQVVHRDLKPSNLMLVDGRPPGKEFLKVLDFGIAKLLDGDNRDTGGRTMTEGFLGTAQYASPEQLLGEPVDGRCDIYATGVILYELLTGRRPFSGPALEQMHAHAYVPAPPFAAANPQARVPPEVERVVLRCLAKDPAHRPQTPRELSEAFRAALRVGSALPDRPEEHAPAGDQQASVTGRAQRARRVGATATIAALLIGMVCILVRDRTGATSTGPVGIPTGPVGDPDRAGPSRTAGSPTAADVLTASWTSGAGGARVVLERGDAAVRLDLVPIPAGRFQMKGASAPADVPPFWMARTETTRAQYACVMGSAPPAAGDRDLPATGMGWHDAVRFCAVLEAALGGRVRAVRLPWEYEWEYAATCNAAMDLVAACRGARLIGPGVAGPRAVGVSKNEWGVDDLLGNASEWILDGFEDDERLAARGEYPQGPDRPDAEWHVVRGGSWRDAAREAVARSGAGTDEGDAGRGFRIVIVARPLPAGESP